MAWEKKDSFSDTIPREANEKSIFGKLFNRHITYSCNDPAGEISRIELYGYDADKKIKIQVIFN